MSCRPDIQYAVSYLARFTAEPTNLVCKAVKRVMQYLVNTHDTQLHLGGEVPSLTAMCDSDFGGDTVGYKSTSGHILSTWVVDQLCGIPSCSRQQRLSI